MLLHGCEHNKSTAARRDGNGWGGALTDEQVIRCWTEIL